jgi:2-oxoglutarate ferredoxin oxidoreductase subunit gamma
MLLPICAPHSLNGRKSIMRQIRLCGFGGQGIVVAGAILGQAAFLDKKFVALSSGYGSQVRGGTTKSDLVFSHAFVDFPLPTEIDFLIAMLQAAYQESLPLVRKDGIIILDRTLVKASPTSPARVYSIPATETVARKLKNEMAANIALLAAANSIGQLVSEASLREAIKKTVSPNFAELNLKAMQVGLELAKKTGA